MGLSTVVLGLWACLLFSLCWSCLIPVYWSLGFVRLSTVLVGLWACVQFSRVCSPPYCSLGCVRACVLFSWVYGPVYCSLGFVGLCTVLLGLWACLLFSWVCAGLSTVLLGLWACVLFYLWACLTRWALRWQQAPRSAPHYGVQSSFRDKTLRAVLKDE